MHLAEVERAIAWLKVDLRLLLWSSDQQWGILLNKWLATPFRQLTLATMESSVAAFQKMLPRMEQRLPANEVGLQAAA